VIGWYSTGCCFSFICLNLSGGAWSNFSVMECVGKHKLGRGVCLDLGIVMGLGGKRYDIYKILFGLHFAYFGTGWINGYHGWAINLWEDG